MSRWVFVLLSALLVSGCTLLFPEQKELQPALPESAAAQQQEIDRHLNNFLAGGDSAVLDKFLAGAPRTKHYDVMRRLNSELKQCRADHADLTAELESRNQLIADLEEKNLLLRETIDQLKGLLIQLEQRAH